MIETLDGLDITHMFTRPQAHRATLYGYMCVRADYDSVPGATRSTAEADRGSGPWTIGGKVTVGKKVTTLDWVQTDGGGAVRLTLTGHTQDDGSTANVWSAKATTGPHTTCTASAALSSIAVGDDTGELKAGGRYTYTAYHGGVTEDDGGGCKTKLGDSVTVTPSN